MWEFFAKGGPVMLVLLACSLAGIYVVIHKYLFLKVQSIQVDAVLGQVKDQLMSVGKDATFRELRTKRKIMLRVLANAIKLSDLSRDDIHDGIKEVTFQEMPKLERNMSILSSIITVSPILGLMGTVMGLMDIFNVISGGGIGDTQALSGGIAEALITTVTGLGISIPLIFLYHYFSNRIDEFNLEMERMTYNIIQFCKLNEAVKP